MPRPLGNQLFESQEEAEGMLPILVVGEKHRAYRLKGGEKYGVFRNTSDRKRVRVVAEEFDSREKAMEYMIEHAEELLTTKLNFGEEILPKPERVYRTGDKRRDGDVVGEDFMEDFGFRGVEFGNWVNQEGRQEVMNHAYDALHDMAELLGVPAKAISLEGDLALAFGARGHGLSGAAAHYEPGKRVINLTKMSGAGHLAHEWLHAMDHYFGRQDGKAERGAKRKTGATDRETFGSHGFSYSRSEVREELRDAYEGLMETIFIKAEKYVEDTKQVELFLGRARDELIKDLQQLRGRLAEQLDPKYWKRKNKPATDDQLSRFDVLSEMIINGEALATELRSDPKSRAHFGGMRMTNDVLEELNVMFKAVRGRAGFKADSKGVLDGVRRSMGYYESRIKLMKEAESKSEKTRKIPTDFRMRAKEADQGRGGSYWATEHELAARAFAAYVEVKLAESDHGNDFLAYHAHGAIIAPVYPEGLFRPYPEGKEREAINSAFDWLFDVMQHKETDKGVALYSRSVDQTTIKVQSEKSADQSAAQAINAGMARHFKDDAWENAYEQRDLPDSLNAIAEGVRAAFGKEIIGISPTDERFNQFNGINYGGKIYVNLDANVDFANIAGHELWHFLEGERPELHQWFAEKARKHYKNFDDYKSRLNSLVRNGERGYDTAAAENELLADFAGDALADPDFLAELAKADGSKFKQLMSAVVKWLKTIKVKLYGKGLGSSDFFNDTEALRKHLNTALVNYARKDGISSIMAMERPKFSRAYTPEQQGAIEKTSTPAKVNSLKSKFDKARENWKVKFRQGALDQFDSIRTVLDDKRAWMMAHMTKASIGALDATINHGVPYMKDNVIQIKDDSKGLTDVLKPLGHEVDDFLRWIAGNRAESLKEQGKENFLSDGEIKALKSLNQGKLEDGSSRAELYMNVRREFEAMNNAVVQIGVDTGLINAEEAAVWKEEGFYVPFYRAMEESDGKPKGPRGATQLVRQTACITLPGLESRVFFFFG